MEDKSKANHKMHKYKSLTSKVIPSISKIEEYANEGWFLKTMVYDSKNDQFITTFKGQV